MDDMIKLILKRADLKRQLEATATRLQALTLDHIKVGDYIKVWTPDVYGFSLEVVKREGDEFICKDIDDGMMFKASELMYTGKNQDYNGIVTDI